MKAKKSETYIFDYEQEFERLERQAGFTAYQLSEELTGFEVESGEVFLDAGCGSGLAARHVAKIQPSAIVEGCDFSAIRVKQAQNRASKERINLRFFESDLQNIQSEDNRYDKIFCRYVFWTFTKFDKLMSEFMRVLKPGGTLLVVDFDGYFTNLDHQNSWLLEAMDEFRVKSKTRIDAFVGRKIPRLFHNAKFEKIDWKVRAVPFQGKDLIDELGMIEERFGFMIPMLVDFFGTEKKAREFASAVCKEIATPGNSLFYNKFIVKGTKPKS
ncbi:methyltransferase domain-containing protein [bacterium]|nr:methyltransferase domain-containing protein [bacterium]